MKCLYCEKEFISQRRTAKYCSDKCKLNYNRKLTKNKLVDISKKTLIKKMPNTRKELKKVLEEIKPLNSYFVYACGCKKTDSKLCPKHKRN
jgi:hypothetical protein